MKPQANIALVRAAQEGRRPAQAEIVARYRGLVFGCAYARLGDFHLAEDVAQEVFVEALANLGTLREPGALASWLRQIARHRCNRVRRRRRVDCVGLEQALTVADPSLSPDEVSEARQRQRRVAEAIASLSLVQREVTILFYLEGHSYEQIAELLGVPLNTVKSRLFAARAQLKERMLEMMKQTGKDHASHAAFMERIEKRLGRKISDEEDARWHREHPNLAEMSPEEHQRLMAEMGISEEEDRRWHEEHDSNDS